MLQDPRVFSHLISDVGKLNSLQLEGTFGDFGGPIRCCYKSENVSLRCSRIKLILFLKLGWVIMIHNQDYQFCTNPALPSNPFLELTPDIAHTVLPQRTHLPTLLFTNVRNCYNDWLTRSSLSAVACFPANSHWGSPTAPDHLKLFLIVGHLTHFDWW